MKCNCCGSVLTVFKDEGNFTHIVCPYCGTGEDRWIDLDIAEEMIEFGDEDLFKMWEKI